jgi:hypothetical protein
VARPAAPQFPAVGAAAATAAERRNNAASHQGTHAETFERGRSDRPPDAATGQCRGAVREPHGGARGGNCAHVHSTGIPTVAGNETSSFPTENPVREPSSEPSPSPTPLANVVAEATAKVEYFFSVPTSALSDGSGGNSSAAASGGGTTTTNTSSNSEAMVSILSDLQVAMNRLAPQVTIHSDRDVRFEPHRGRHYRRHMRKSRRLQALQVLLPTSFGNLAQVGT